MKRVPFFSRESYQCVYLDRTDFDSRKGRKDCEPIPERIFFFQSLYFYRLNLFHIAFGLVLFASLFQHLWLLMQLHILIFSRFNYIPVSILIILDRLFYRRSFIRVSSPQDFYTTKFRLVLLTCTRFIVSMKKPNE